ncbi:Protein of unknown function [Gryllus bimaculatus]|nr:Protein of unknown function [Gryllus bimaculatus]
MGTVDGDSASENKKTACGYNNKTTTTIPPLCDSLSCRLRPSAAPCVAREVCVWGRNRVLNCAAAAIRNDEADKLIGLRCHSLNTLEKALDLVETNTNASKSFVSDKDKGKSSLTVENNILVVEMMTSHFKILQDLEFVDPTYRIPRQVDLFLSGEVF